MAGEEPNYEHRSFLLPHGAKNLGEAPKLKRPKRPASTPVRVNARIISPTVDLRDDKGEKLGVQPLQDALRLALEQKVDLVEINSKKKPPVCVLIDFGRYRYLEDRGEIPKTWYE